MKMDNRWMRFAALGMLAALPAISSEAVAANDSALKPASMWKISSEPYACHLERSFGEGAPPIELQLRRQVTRGPLRWTILFPSQGTRSVRATGRVEKWPQQEKADFEGVRGALGNSGQNYLVWESGTAVESFVDDQILRISATGDLDWSLQASGMAKAIAALDDCVSGLRKDLGYNENVAVKAEPVMEPNPGTWATNDDYPAQSRRNKDEGIAHFLLMISDTGQVKDCHIIDSSGFAELDAKTCELMRQRAKFHPAKDASGAAVDGEFISWVTWKLPQ